jgi:hypothetical protein
MCHFWNLVNAETQERFLVDEIEEEFLSWQAALDSFNPGR